MKFNIHLFATPTGNLCNPLSAKLNLIPPDQFSGIYEIPIHLNNYKKIYYIGITKRRFFERFKEHQSDIKFRRLTITLARLSAETKIKSIDFNIDIIKASYKAAAGVSIDIIMRQNNICNNNLSFSFCNVMINLLKKIYFSS